MTKALADGLAARNGGSIDNGPTLPRPKASRPWSGRTVATPVVVNLVPWWDCDTVDGCRGTGVGADTMLEHAATDHAGRGRFTDRRWS